MEWSKTSYKPELGVQTFLILFSQVSINSCMKLLNFLILLSLILFISRRTTEGMLMAVLNIYTVTSFDLRIVVEFYPPGCLEDAEFHSGCLLI